MDVKLVVVGGKNAGRVIPIPGTKFFIGRAEDCHLRPNSDLVSRHHCAIIMNEQGVTVRDFGSRNGTLVNGERIKEEHPLRTKDHLQVGPLEFEVILGVSLSTPKKPKVKSVEEAAARTVQSAAAKTADPDMDISEWVTEPVDGSADTKAMNTAPTGTVSMNTPSSDTETVKTDEPETPPEAEQPEEPKKTKPKSTTGGHGIKKPKAADSQAAAAETLRAFFNRR